MTEQEKYEAYLQMLEQPFIKLCRLRFLNPDGTTAFFVDSNEKNPQSGAFIADGSISVNLQNGVRRTASVTFSNVDGAFDYNVNNLWFGDEVALDEGLVLPDGEEYYIQQGVFLLEEPAETVQPGIITITYRLVDKWANLDGTLWGKLEGTYRGKQGENIFRQINALLQDDRGNGRAVDSVAPVYTDYYYGGVHFAKSSIPAGSNWHHVAGNERGGAVAIGVKTGYTNDGGKTWVQTNTYFTVKARIAYGDGVYIVIDRGGNLYRSLDGGKTWELPTTLNGWEDGTAFGIAYGNGRFIATCAMLPSGYAISTDKGKTWDVRTIGGHIESVHYADKNRFLFVGRTANPDGMKNYVYVRHSDDGGQTIHWHESAFSNNENEGYTPVIIFENGRCFFVIPNTDRAWWSDDLDNWEQIKLPYVGNWTAGAAGGGIVVLFSASKENGFAIYSMNGGKEWRLAVGTVPANVTDACRVGTDVFIRALFPAPSLYPRETLYPQEGARETSGFVVIGQGDAYAQYSQRGMVQKLSDGTLAPLTDAPYTLEVSPGGGSYADVILGFAEMLNAWVGYDADGRLRIDPSQDDIPDETKPLSYSFSMNKTVLNGMTYTTKNAAVYNDYIVMGDALEDGSQPGGRAVNLDPNSDTNVKIIGRKVKWTSQNGYTTSVQCQDRAAWEMKRSAVLQKSVNVSCGQILHIRENEVVEIVRTDKPGSPTERHLIMGFSRPLKGTEAMNISAVSVADFPEATLEMWPLVGT